MSSASSNIVFDDIFTINAIDKEGKKFDRVSRLYARSKNHDMDMTLDFNVELFPLSEGQSFAMALASTLFSSGGGDVAEAEDKDRNIWRPDGKGVKGLEEEYDYVMFGKDSVNELRQVYKFDGGGEIVYGELLRALGEHSDFAQDRIRVVRRFVIVADRIFSAYGWYCSR
ncbi:RNA polymerase [Boletus reticuloceps]|uniref:RNA polymerase n=1 Tax=Boletus reticuloceps TaxID=495285 RepID=A0A8I2YYY8_9AGAM|nr:RNA polymerase [Boletus reticuloceps]